jgi:hypothetical protein
LNHSGGESSESKFELAISYLLIIGVVASLILVAVGILLFYSDFGNLAISEKNGWEKFVTLEAMYSLAARWLEHEMIPACLDQGIAILAYSPLHAGLLTGKYRRGQPWPQDTRISTQEDAAEKWPFEKEKLFRKFLILFCMMGVSLGLIGGFVLTWYLDANGFSLEAIGLIIGMQILLAGIFTHLFSKPREQNNRYF